MVELVEGKWRVMEAVAIGKIDSTENAPAGGTFIEAGYMDRTTEAIEPQLVDDQYIFNLAGTEKAMWIKIK